MGVCLLRGTSCLQDELNPDNGYKGHMKEGFWTSWLPSGLGVDPKPDTHEHPTLFWMAACHSGLVLLYLGSTDLIRGWVCSSCYSPDTRLSSLSSKGCQDMPHWCCIMLLSWALPSGVRQVTLADLGSQQKGLWLVSVHQRKSPIGFSWPQGLWSRKRLYEMLSSSFGPLGTQWTAFFL